MKKSYEQPFKDLISISNLKDRIITMIDFTKIDYLKSGTDKQKQAYRILSENLILEKLKSFDPLLTGTIPINIDLDTSDLDIICCFANREVFQTHLMHEFGQQQNFNMFTPKHPGTVAAVFTADGFSIEIFGQPVPTLQQAAYRHMVVEHKLLLEKGEDFRKQIVELKKQGYKTEPAFGKLLGLTGDAYQELLVRYES
jgi:Domain of unknown function (DUF4269)